MFKMRITIQVCVWVCGGFSEILLRSPYPELAHSKYLINEDGCHSLHLTKSYLWSENPLKLLLFRAAPQAQHGPTAHC